MEEENSFSSKDELVNIEDNIAKNTGEIKKSWHHVKLSVVGMLAILGIDGGIIYWASLYANETFTYHPNSDNSLFNLFMLFIVINLFVGLPSFMFLVYEMVLNLNKSASHKAEVERWKSRKDVISLVAKNTAKLSYFDNFALINASNLDDYYKEIKKQTNNSYKIVYTISILGFILIITGIIAGFINFTHSNMVSYISATSGVITEAISSIFFALHSRTVQQMKEYHNNLLNTQNILLSFNLVDKTKDDGEKTKIIEQMIIHLTDKQVMLSNKAEK